MKVTVLSRLDRSFAMHKELCPDIAKEISQEHAAVFFTGERDIAERLPSVTVLECCEEKPLLKVVRSRFTIPLATDKAWDTAHLKFIAGFRTGDWAHAGDGCLVTALPNEKWLVVLHFGALVMSTEAAQTYLQSVQVETDKYEVGRVTQYLDRATT